MKGLIYYYSGSGNTKLACQYISAKISNAELELLNIVKEEPPQTEEYDIIGFATFTDFLGVPHLMGQFIEQLKEQDKPAFVFNTYGFLSGKTLRHLKGLAASQGFQVIAGYSLHTPENYPPMIVRGRGAEDSPNEKELASFNQFIVELDQILADIQAGEKAKSRIRIGTLNSIIPAMSRSRARKDMGEKLVDKSLCKECGICKKGCPYEAIELDPKPVFDMNKCYGCWACYNHCPEKAIYTRKFRNIGHYPKPNEQLREKLSIGQ